MTQPIDPALKHLSRFPEFAFILKHYGQAPLWQRPQGFSSLLHIILEQQVSLASAQASFDKLLRHICPITPEAFLSLDDATLKAIGFSRQKTHYGRSLATALVTASLDLVGLEHLSDHAASSELRKLPGIGPWTANIYLLMVLGRQDIWPKGDVALASAYQTLLKLGERPSQDALECIAESWQPYRSEAARLLWHYYLSK